MKIIFSPEALEDYNYFKKFNSKIVNELKLYLPILILFFLIYTSQQCAKLRGCFD